MEKVNSRNIECLQDNTTHLVFAMLVPQFDPSLAKRICGYIQEAHGSHQFDWSWFLDSFWCSLYVDRSQSKSLELTRVPRWFVCWCLAKQCQPWSTFLLVWKGCSFLVWHGGMLCHDRVGSRFQCAWSWNYCYFWWSFRSIHHPHSHSYCYQGNVYICHIYHLTWLIYIIVVDWWCSSQCYSCSCLCSTYCQGQALWHQVLCRSIERSQDL